MLGKTNSYYIRKRHEELILREYRRHRHRTTAPVLWEHIARLAVENSEEDAERAFDMAALDECMAKPAGAVGATTSPVSTPLFTSGGAFFHTLLMHLRDLS